MSKYTLVETEKSFKVQEKNFYLIRFEDKSFDPNKIQVKQLLLKDGLHVEKVTVSNAYSKLKRRGKKNSKIAQKRAKKYFVKLKIGEKIEVKTEENTLK
jgi:ribosomal protein L23